MPELYIKNSNNTVYNSMNSIAVCEHKFNRTKYNKYYKKKKKNITNNQYKVKIFHWNEQEYIK